MKVLDFLSEIYSNQTSKNFSALAMVQATNYIFPVITLPYVLSMVGTEHYGMVALAQAIFTYQIIITDYGFNLTSSSKIAQSRDDKNKVSHILSETLTIKLGLLIIMFGILQLMLLVIPSFSENSRLWNYGFLLVVGHTLLPTWYFQGIEKMHFLTYTNLITKFVSVVLIFVMIKSKEDFVYILALNGFGNFLSAIICLILIFVKFKVLYILPDFRSIKAQLRDGLSIFYSNVLTNFYINSNIIILSHFATSEALGVYSVAEKIVQMIRSILVVFYQATFPRVSHLKSKGIIVLKEYYRKAFLPFITLILIGSIVCIVLAEFILLFISGKATPEMILYLRVFCIVPFIVALNIPPNQILLIYERRKAYFMIILLGTILNIALTTILSYSFSALGTIVSVLITEVFITAGYYYAFKTSNINDGI